MRTRSGYVLLVLLLLLAITIPTARASAATSQTCYNQDTGEVEACKEAGPPSITASDVNNNQIKLLTADCVKVFPELSSQTAILNGAKDILSNPAVCKAYKDLYAKYPDVGECTANSGVSRLEAITGLNPDFAVAMDKVLQQPAMAHITIQSAYRKNPCPNRNGIEAKISNHMVGCAVDLNYSTDNCNSEACKFMENQAPAEFGVQIRIKSSPEWNHIEPVKVDVCQQKGHGGGAVPGAPGPIAARTPPPPNAEPKIGNSDCRTIGGQWFCPASNPYSPFGGNSLFGGDMMKMMLGMQLGQGLGQMLGGLFSGSGNKTTAGPTIAALPPAPLPPVTGTTISTTPVSTKTTTGSSTIDALIAALNNPSATTSSSTSMNAKSPVVVGSSTEGVLQMPSAPPATTTQASSNAIFTLPSITLADNSFSTSTGTISSAIATSGSASTSTASSTTQAIVDKINATIATLKDFIARLLGFGP